MNHPEEILTPQRSGHDAPLITLAMSLIVALAVPAVLCIVFIVWPESLARQLTATGVVLILLVLVFFRRKFEALLLATVFLSQFGLSLHSFDLAPPVKLQILFSDVVLLVFLFVAVERRTRFRLDHIGWIFLALCLWFAVATTTSVHPHRSLIFLFIQFKYFLLYCLARAAELDEKFVGRVVYIVLGVVILQGLLAIAQTLKGGPLGLHILGEFSANNLENLMVQGKLRPAGTFGGTNGFAGYMAMLLVFLLPFLMARRSLLLFGGYAIGGMALILALSRAGWLSFMVGTVCVVVMMLRSRLVRMTRLLIFAVLGGLVLVAGIGLYYENIMHRFRDREAVQSAVGRFTQIAQAWEVVEKFPVHGIGPGVTEFFGRWNDNRKYIKRALPGVNLHNQVHSSQLQVAIETGIPGLGLFLLLTAALVLAVPGKVKPALSSKNPALLRVGGSCAAVAALMHMTFGTEFNSQQLFLGFWALLGMARSWRAAPAVAGEIPAILSQREVAGRL